MKIKDFIGLFLALLGFGITNGSANDQRWSILWAVAGLLIALSGIMLFCMGRETNATD